MRAILKKDDGLLDLMVKLVTIAAFLVAAHQYYYKIYPVWDKEHKLAELTTELENKKSSLERALSDLEVAQKAHAETIIEVNNAQKRLSEIELKSTEKQKALNAKIREMRVFAEKLKEKYAIEKQNIIDELESAKQTIETKNSVMVGVYLEKFANDVFLIQIDNIRWSKGNEKLDLKKEIIKYVAEHLNNEKNEIKIVALKIFKHFAEDEIKPGEKEYSKAIGVSFYYRFNEKAQDMIKTIKNV